MWYACVTISPLQYRYHQAEVLDNHDRPVRISFPDFVLECELFDYAPARFLNDLACCRPSSEVVHNDICVCKSLGLQLT